MSETLILIPAREGSTRVKNKNRRSFSAEGTLLEIATRKCESLAEALEEDWSIIVSNDGFRAPEYCGDLPMDAVVSDVMNMPWDKLIIVQCTSPFLRGERIVQANQVLDRHDAVKTVTRHKTVHRHHFDRWWQRGGIFAEGFVEGGGLHGITRKALEEGWTINNCPDTACIIVSEEEGIDIDTEFEFEMAQLLWDKRNA